MGDEEGTSNGGGAEGTVGFHYLKSEAMNNGISIGIGNDGGEYSSGGSEGFRTYKRRRHGRSSADSKDRDDERVCVEAASRLAAQVFAQSLFLLVACYTFNCKMGFLCYSILSSCKWL